MCLTEIIKKKTELSEKSLINYKNRIGYKVLRIYNNHLYSEFYNLLGNKQGVSELNKNIWYCSSDTIIKDNDNNKYKSGFHIFLNKFSAERWCEPNEIVIKVKFKNISCVGIQSRNLEVVVAKEMLIMKD